MKRIQSRSQDKWMHGGNTLAYQHVSGGGRKSEPGWNLHRTTGGNLRTDLKSVFDSGVYERTTPQSIRVHEVWHTSCLNSSVFIFRFVDTIIFPKMLYTTWLLVVFASVLVALTHGCNVTHSLRAELLSQSSNCNGGIFQNISERMHCYDV